MGSSSLVPCLGPRHTGGTVRFPYAWHAVICPAAAPVVTIGTAQTRSHTQCTSPSSQLPVRHNVHVHGSRPPRQHTQPRMSCSPNQPLGSSPVHFRAASAVSKHNAGVVDVVYVVWGCQHVAGRGLDTAVWVAECVIGRWRNPLEQCAAKDVRMLAAAAVQAVQHWHQCARQQLPAVHLELRHAARTVEMRVQNACEASRERARPSPGSAVRVVGGSVRVRRAGRMVGLCVHGFRCVIDVVYD